MALIKRDLEIDNWHDLSTSGSFERELLTGSSAPVPGIPPRYNLAPFEESWHGYTVHIKFTSFSDECNMDYSRD